MDLIVQLGIALFAWANFLQAARSSRPLRFWCTLRAGAAAGAVCTFSWWGVWIALTGMPFVKDFPPFTMLLICVWLVAALAFQSLCRRHAGRGCRHIVLILLGTCPVQLALIFGVSPSCRAMGFLSVPIGVRIGGAMVAIALVWTLIAGIVLLFIPARPRYPLGCCQECGYNLRGLPEPRCPECGTPFTEEQTPPQLERRD